MVYHRILQRACMSCSNSPPPNAAHLYTPTTTARFTPAPRPLCFAPASSQPSALKRLRPLQPRTLTGVRPLRARPFLVCRLVNLERGRADLVAWLGLEEARAPWKEIFAKVQSDHPDVWSRWAAGGSCWQFQGQTHKGPGGQEPPAGGARQPGYRRLPVCSPSQGAQLCRPLHAVVVSRFSRCKGRTWSERNDCVGS